MTREYDFNRLALAIILQAARDARGGDLEAAEWILETGATWLQILNVSFKPADLRAAINPAKADRNRQIKEIQR